MVDTNTGTRGVQIIDTSQLDVATATDRGTGSQNHAYKADGADMKLEYDNNWSSKNNCVSARSREKILTAPPNRNIIIPITVRSFVLSTLRTICHQPVNFK